MTRKTKAFWIGFVAPVVMLWAWMFVRWGGMGMALFWTIPAIVAGGLVSVIACLYAGGPPMSRRGKAAWIGFLVPMVPAWGIVLIAIFMCATQGSGKFQYVGTQLAVRYIGGPSILLGGVIAAIAFACTKNKDKDPLKCVGCGYSLVGLTGDKCPECGHTVSSTSPS